MSVPLRPRQTASAAGLDLGALGRFLGVDRRTLAPAVGRGLIVSIATLVPIVSYPTLVFSGALEAYSGVGVGLGLISAFLLTMALVIAGSLGGTVGVAQSEPAVVLSVAATHIAADLQAAGRPELILPTILALTLVAAVSVGAIFLVVGTLRAGNVIRFVPYPVVVGFIGGMGWLLIEGAVRVASGHPPTLASMGALFAPGTLVRWLPAIATGVGLWLLQRLRPRPFNIPIAAFGTVAAFWVVVLVVGLRHADMVADGWMLAPIPSIEQWHPEARFSQLAMGAWPLVLGHWPQLLTLITVALIGVLMQASVIEIAARTDVDLNRELRALGTGNLLGALTGNMPGYHSLSASLLSIRLGQPARCTGLVVAVVAASILLFGGGAINCIPKLVIGALLIYVGLDVLSTAVMNVHLRRAPAEFAIAGAVFSCVAFVGLLEGLGLGVIAGVILFVVKYSQVDVVRRSGSGIEFHSNVERSPRSRAILDHAGEQLFILQLQGYVFFGTSALVLSRIRTRLQSRDAAPPRFVLLDLRRVSGIDSSVSLSLTKLAQYARSYAFGLVVCGIDDDVRDSFRRLIPEAGEGRVRLFADLDHALEFCENQLLAEAALPLAEESLEAQLRQSGGDDDQIAVVLAYLERCAYDDGEVLIRQGEPSSDLYFVERGAVTIRLALPGDRTVRLRTMGVGTVVGEVAVYLGRPRSASVVAAGPTIAARLSGEALARMQAKEPAAAALVHAFMARQLAVKLVAATQQVAASHL